MIGIPVFTIRANTVPEAWEKAVLKVWHEGINIKTEYDKEDDPPSKDAMVTIIVDGPFIEPRIHKNFPGGPVELEVYRQEVLYGIHNHWIKDGTWTYTYNQRLFNYSFFPNVNIGEFPPMSPSLNQVEYMVEKLSKVPHSRRAQGITWIPTIDENTEHPPCLQRIWARITENHKGLYLDMHTYWRSRDLYNAWFMNVYVLTELQKIMADKISENINKEIKVGRYIDVSDSLHIYGSYFNKVKPEIGKMLKKPLSYVMNDCLECQMLFNYEYYEEDSLKDFIKNNQKKRTYKTNDPSFKMMTEEARKNLEINKDYYKHNGTR